LSIVQIITTVTQFIIQAVQFKEALGKVESCVNKYYSINISNLNASNIDKLRFDKQCKNLINKAKGKSGLDCLLSPGECSLAGWLTLATQIIDPNALDAWINTKLNMYFDRLIDNLIRVGAKKCSVPRDDVQVQVVALDSIIDQEINANDILSELMPNVVSTSLFQIKIIPLQKNLVRQVDLSNCQNSVSSDLAQYCLIVRRVYPYADSGTYCIYNVTKKQFNITVYGNYDKCRIYFSKEKPNPATGNINYYNVLVKEVNNCHNTVKLSFTQNFLRSKLNELGNDGYAYYLVVVPVQGNSELNNEKVSTIFNPNWVKKSSYLVKECSDQSSSSSVSS